MQEDQSRRRIISRLMREAASIFNEGNSTDMAPALPKMRAAVMLAEQMDDKTPLLICQANLAWMNAVCGRSHEAMTHIERALDVAMDPDIPVPVRNFAFTKFVEMAVLLQRDHERALTYARALLQSAADEEGNYQQFLASLFNLSVVAQDLLRSPDWAVAILSWIDDNTAEEHPVGRQARRSVSKILERFPALSRDAWLCEVEANRDTLLDKATGGFLPHYAPPPPSPDNPWQDSHDDPAAGF